MIEVSRTLSVNDGADPALRVDDVWDGLMDKAENPLLYVSSMSQCTVTERFDGGLVREVVHVGQPVREVVTFYPKQRVHFVRTHGTARGTIDNEIALDDAGEPTLTFSFRIVVDGVQPGSAEEKDFAAHMEADYLDAVQTTLKAVRGRAAGATTGTSV
ncbi:SRPBCC family protein [Streptomyces sp. NPDC055134]